jgi:hypothetical protein
MEIKENKIHSKFTLFRHVAQPKLFFLTNPLHRLKISQSIESGTHFTSGPFIPHSHTTTQSCFDTIFFAQMQSGWQKNYKRYSPWAANKKRQTPLGRRVCRGGAQVPGQTERKRSTLYAQTHVPFLSSRRVQWPKQIIKAVGERKNPLLIRLSANSNNPLYGSLLVL